MLTKGTSLQHCQRISPDALQFTMQNNVTNRTNGDDTALHFIAMTQERFKFGLKPFKML